MSSFYASYPVSGGGGVSSLNGLTGALTLVAGAGITITPSGTNITIAATPGSFLPPPLEALALYTSDFQGSPGTFLGNDSDSDQTNQLIALGSTDSAIAANATSTVLLLAGDLTNASSTGNSGAVAVGGGNIVNGSGQAGGVSLVAGSALAGTGTAGRIRILGGSSVTNPGGDVRLNPGNGSVTGYIQLDDNSGTITAGQIWTAVDTQGSGHWASNAGANTTLSNLIATTAINQDLVFNTGTTARITSQSGQQLIISSNQELQLVQNTASIIVEDSAIEINTNSTSTGNLSIAGTTLDLFGDGVSTTTAVHFWDALEDFWVGLQAPTSVASNILWTLPSTDSTGTQALTSNGSGTLGWTSIPAAGANTTLSNLSSVAINTSLLPASSGSANLGSSSLPFGSLFVNSIKDTSNNTSIDPILRNLIDPGGLTQVNWTSSGVTIGNSSSVTKGITLNVATATPALGALTLTNAPTGRSGNPAGYLQITINGTTAYMPFWT